MANVRRVRTMACLASYYKGSDFLRECKDQGFDVVLITREKLLNEAWPRESLDEIRSVPDDAKPEDYLQALVEIGRHRQIDAVVALEEFDVVTAGFLREHFCLPGMTASEARLFRDKLAMRDAAQAAGIRVPEFVHALNYEALNDFVDRVSPPWVLKPRSDVSAIGIKKLGSSDELKEAITEVNDRPIQQERSSYYLLERYVGGRVFHVDSIVYKNRVVYALANAYGRPPIDVAHAGGVFLSHTLKYGSKDSRDLISLNRKVISALGLESGVAHAEFIKSDEDQSFYFLEIAARVGGAFIAETFEAASGLNLWREWARIEQSRFGVEYAVNPRRREYAGIALSLARQEFPDTSTYVEPEIAYRVNKPYHVGLIVRSPKPERVSDLLDQYSRRFAEDFCAVAPPLERRVESQG
jgi:biotin carboxylase